MPLSFFHPNFALTRPGTRYTCLQGVSFPFFFLCSRRLDGVPVPRVHPVHPEGVPGERADLRARVDFREGGRLRHGQVRQEEGTRVVEAELRDAMHGREGVPVQVSFVNKWAIIQSLWICLMVMGMSSYYVGWKLTEIISWHGSMAMGQSWLSF